MRMIFVLFIIALLGCAASKPVAVAEKPVAKCQRIANAPEWIRESLKMSTSNYGLLNGADTIPCYGVVVCDNEEYCYSFSTPDGIIDWETYGK
jgi:hypothetical protein